MGVGISSGNFPKAFFPKPLGKGGISDGDDFSGGEGD